MKKFCLKILLFTTIIILIITASILFNRFIPSKRNLLTYSNKTTIIIGASRTAWSLNDKYIDSTLNVSSNGDPLFYSFIKLKLFKKYNPQLNKAILSFDNRTLDTKIAERYYNSNSLRKRLPIYSYYLSFKELQEIVGSDYYSLIKSIDKIPNRTLKMVNSTFSKSKKLPKDLNFGGHNEININLNKDSINKFIKYDTLRGYKISKIEVKNLSKIINFCNSNDIKLFFINPPLHKIMYNSNQYQEGKKIFDAFYNKNFSKVTYLDYSNKFLPDSCYADLIHLNKKGAEFFSKEINNVLKFNLAE